MIHVAAQPVRIGQYLRQRCAWCGAVLLDYDLAGIAVPEGQDPMPGTWQCGGLIQVDGQYSSVVEHEDGAPVPADCCAALDPAVTLLSPILAT
jgi:hypothetical protein